jgi:hypothetical protein
VFERGLCPLFKTSSSSPFKERGIQGVRLINNLVKKGKRN